jgi:pseudouridine synthase
MSEVRLQKLLASAGIASRRAAEELITAGRVRVNGRVVRELGAKADLKRDKITVDGRTLVRERHVYYLLHKPRGYVTTVRDPEGRPTVMDLLKGVTERVFPVGRLDWNTAGALLVTNDGDLAQALMHPRQKVEKTYAVKLQGHPNEEALERLRKGVELDDGRTAPADVWILSTGPGATWLRVTIREGRNRQIHRMGEAVGHKVLRLTRTEFAGLNVDDLRPGEMRPLSSTEIDDLRQTHLGAAPRKPPTPPRAHASRDKAPRRASGRRPNPPGEGRSAGDDRPTTIDTRGPAALHREPPVFGTRATMVDRPKRAPPKRRSPRADDRPTAFVRKDAPKKRGR